MGSRARYDGNTEEENNGYVVFERNIHGLGGKKDGNKGESLLRSPPPLSTAGFLKGPKHDQVGYEFFYIKQTRMVR
jgi:hypothetical protein